MNALKQIESSIYCGVVVRSAGRVGRPARPPVTGKVITEASHVIIERQPGGQQ